MVKVRVVGWEDFEAAIRSRLGGACAELAEAAGRRVGEIAAELQRPLPGPAPRGRPPHAHVPPSRGLRAIHTAPTRRTNSSAATITGPAGRGSSLVAAEVNASHPFMQPAMRDFVDSGESQHLAAEILGRTVRKIPPAPSDAPSDFL